MDLNRQLNDLCIAEANEQEAEAEDYANSLSTIMLALAVGIASAIAAAFGTAALIKVVTALVGAPIAIAIVAGGLVIGAIIASVLLAVTVDWITAQAVASLKRQITSGLRNLKAQAITRVQTNCSDEESQACIDNLVPCS